MEIRVKETFPKLTRIVLSRDDPNDDKKSKTLILGPVSIRQASQRSCKLSKVILDPWPQNNLDDWSMCTYFLLCLTALRLRRDSPFFIFYCNLPSQTFHTEIPLWLSLPHYTSLSLSFFSWWNSLSIIFRFLIDLWFKHRQCLDWFSYSFTYDNFNKVWYSFLIFYSYKWKCGKPFIFISTFIWFPTAYISVSLVLY